MKMAETDVKPFSEQFSKALSDNEFSKVHELLQVSRVDVNSDISKSTTALHVAIMKQNVEMVQLLVQRGADLLKPSYCHICDLLDPPLLAAAHTKNMQIFSFLLTTGRLALENYTQVIEQVFYWALRHSHLRIAETLLEHDCDVNAVLEDSKDSMLHLAAEANQTESVAWLFQKGALVRENRAEQTPLHVAAEQQNLPIAALLLNHGANPNHVDRFGNTPFYHVLVSFNYSFINDFIQVCGNRKLLVGSNSYRVINCLIAECLSTDYTGVEIILRSLNKEEFNEFDSIDLDSAIRLFRKDLDNPVYLFIVKYIFEHSSRKIPEDVMVRFNWKVMHWHYQGPLRRTRGIVWKTDFSNYKFGFASLCIRYGTLPRSFFDMFQLSAVDNCKVEVVQLLIKAGVGVQDLLRQSHASKKNFFNRAHLSHVVKLIDWLSECQRTPQSLLHMSRVVLRRLITAKESSFTLLWLLREMQLPDNVIRAVTDLDDALLPPYPEME